MRPIELIGSKKSLSYYLLFYKYVQVSFAFESVITIQSGIRNNQDFSWATKKLADEVDKQDLKELDTNNPILTLNLILMAN